MSGIINLPPQQLPLSKKTKKWRKQIVDWADNKTVFNYSPVRKSVEHKKINYDLLEGKLHMSDLALVLNPDNVKANYVPEQIQHYPIMNSKLFVLRGEEASRVFDYRVIVTNPNAISEIENNKKEELFQRLQEAIANQAQSEEEFNQELDKLNQYYTYEWQDMREIRCNALLNHYVKEYNMPLMFNDGLVDAEAVGEEIYQCDIRGGEPIIKRLNPNNVYVFRSGYSNKIEDADMIIIEEYLNPGQIIDEFHDVLTQKDVDYIESLPTTSGEAASDSMGNIDERLGFVGEEGILEESPFESVSTDNSLLPFDFDGNIKVTRVYWKSRRRIKKVKSFDPNTGEEIYSFKSESYVIDKDKGEEEKILYINEAWEGTKIGEEVYVNMRPRTVQYNRLSNPSRCHFGIVGGIYNMNDSKPFSLVDMMKQYNYLYDVIHDRLNKMMARNWGKIVRLDLAKVPKGWDINKWMYYAKTNGIAVEDSFREGNYGAATGKLAGGLNNANSGYIDAEYGNSIQQNINLLEFIKMEMSEIVGISKQREGQISNRETVGGIERSTLQSSHITEWLFTQHEDIKRRALECFLETAKIALKGRSKKFQYILPDKSIKIVDIDGDEFAEADYGILVDNSRGTQELSQKLDMLAQAALQNQTLSFSTIMKLYSSNSIAEKQRMVESDEMAIQERNAQQQQQQLQAQQQIAQQQNEVKMMEIQQKDTLNQRDNETKILIATMQMESNDVEDGIEEPEFSEEAKANLQEKIREFDTKIQLDKERLAFDKEKAKKDAELKNKQIAKQSRVTSK